MNYKIAENGYCLVTILDMIIENETGKSINKESVAIRLNAVIPNGDSFTELNDIGVKIDPKKLSSVLDFYNCLLEIKYVEGWRLYLDDIDNTLRKYISNYRYVVLACSYGYLYHVENLYDLGHVVLLNSVVDDNTLEVYDPGPDGAGMKQVNILSMSDAMRYKGGILLFT